MSNFFSFKWFTDFIHVIVDLFHKANKEFIDSAITITNTVKTLLSSPVTDWAVQLTSTPVDDKILAWARVKLPLILAAELGFKDLNADSSAEAVQAFMVQAIGIFGGLSDAQKEELWTSIAAQIYKQLEADLADKTISFGEAASLIETGWKAWQKLHDPA
jgi:hypothetical protein